MENRLEFFNFVYTLLTIVFRQCLAEDRHLYLGAVFLESTRESVYHLWAVGFCLKKS